MVLKVVIIVSDLLKYNFREHKQITVIQFYGKLWSQDWYKISYIIRTTYGPRKLYALYLNIVPSSLDRTVDKLRLAKLMNKFSLRLERYADPTWLIESINWNSQRVTAGLVYDRDDEMFKY